eukprot:scaffold7740_cov112-Isochrysis_galbana.AAC.8
MAASRRRADLAKERGPRGVINGGGDASRRLPAAGGGRLRAGQVCDDSGERLTCAGWRLCESCGART